MLTIALLCTSFALLLPMLAIAISAARGKAEKARLLESVKRGETESIILLARNLKKEMLTVVLKITEADFDNQELHQWLVQNDSMAVKQAFKKYRNQVTIPDAVIHSDPEITVSEFQTAIHDCVYDNYIINMYRKAKSRIGNGINSEKDAEDAVADAVYDLFRYIYSFDGSASFASYFEQCVIHSANRIAGRNRLRGESAVSALSDSEVTKFESFSVKDQYITPGRERLRELVGDILNDLEFEVVYLYFFEQLPHIKIAEKTNKSHANIRKIHSRAMEKLRKALGNGAEWLPGR